MKTLRLLAFAVLLALMGLNSSIGESASAQDQDCTVTVRPGESIQQAIDQAQEGTVICLAEGTWEENVKIEKSLTLLGAGADKTAVKALEAGYPVVWIESEGEIGVLLKRISLTGALSYAEDQLCAPFEEPICPDGLQVRGRARVAIEDSIISDNQRIGFLVEDAVQVTLTHSQVSNNKDDGFYVKDLAQVALTDSQVSNNGSYGLVAKDEAQATLQNSQIFGNGFDGLAIWDSARVTLTDSTVSNNGSGGLVVGGSSQATLQNSIVSGNDERGLEVMSSARVTLQDSRVSDNGWQGFEVEEGAQVILTSSTVAGNGLGGFEVKGWAQVTLTGSQVLGNKGHGFFLRDSTRLTLTNSQVSDNEKSGLNLGESAQANLTNSQLSRNGWDGLWMTDESRASLEDSTLSGNGDDGLDVGRDALVELRGETSLHDNGGCGIQVRNQEMQVASRPLEMHGNWVDLCGFAPVSLRKPLVPQTDRRQLFVPGDYPTLQEAIDAIAPGGTVILTEDIYQEGVTVWKPVTIRGAGPEGPILDALYEHDPVISILAEAQEVRLEGLQITGTRSKGAALEIGSRVELVNLRILGNEGNALRAYGEARMILDNTQVSGNGGTGLFASQVDEINDSWISDNGGCGIAGGGKLPSITESTINGGNNWVKDNFQDFCDFSPPAGFLRESPPRPLREEAEVCPTCEFTQPWQAIIAVGSGATVRLRAGSYRPPVMIAKDLTLIGEGPDRTIIAGAQETGIVIGGEAVAELRDLQVFDNGLSGLSVKGEARVILTNSTVSDNRLGLSVEDSAQVTLTSSQVSGNEADGLSIWDSAQVTLIHSQVSGNDGDGFEVWDSARLTLQDSTITDNGEYGLNMMLGSSAQVSLTNSEVTGNGWAGLSISGLSQATLTHTTVSENGKDGLWVQGSAQVEVGESTIQGNGTAEGCENGWICNGIFVQDEARVTVRDSVIRNNTDWGVAAHLEKCGSLWDAFEGEVELINTEIYNNGLGDVCLP